MAGLDNLDYLFIAWAFFFQIVQVLHFALRKWRFERSIRYGPLVYALGFPAAVVSLILLVGGKTFEFWLAGFLCLLWAAFGYWIDYVKRIEWREPIRWPVAIPYLFLYLATIMFYWWPLDQLGRPYWFTYTLLFILATWLNISSHKKPQEHLESA